MHPVPRSVGLLHPLLAPRCEVVLKYAGRQCISPYGTHTVRSRLPSCPAYPQAKGSARAIQALLLLFRPSVP
eukprot:10470172-Lingulodinium_polyedra.AAC.1